MKVYAVKKDIKQEYLTVGLSAKQQQRDFQAQNLKASIQEKKQRHIWKIEMFGLSR